MRGRGVVEVQEAGVGRKEQGVLESYIDREGPGSSGVVHW